MLYFTKMLSLLLEPLVVGLGMAALGLVVSRWRRRVGLVVAALGVGGLWLASTPLVGEALLGSLEAHHLPRPVATVPPADAIVVLGGAIGGAEPPRQHPDLHDASDRIWHAARLFHAGKAPTIIASGGRLPWLDERASEARVMRDGLTAWGVPADSVLLEEQSATTRGNAIYTAQLAVDRGFDRLLLVTSAAHMPRALATVRAACRDDGIDVVAAPTDVRVVGARSWSLVPTVAALDATSLAIHERVGALVYTLRGWM